MGSARDANRSEGKRKIVAGPLCKSVKAGKNCPSAWEWLDTTQSAEVTDSNVRKVYRCDAEHHTITTTLGPDHRRHCKDNPNCVRLHLDYRASCERQLQLLDTKCTKDLRDMLGIGSKKKGSEVADGKAVGKVGVGLINLGATCYVNSLLQMLFWNPAFRSAVFQWEDPNGEDQILTELQRVFGYLQLGLKQCYDPSHFIDRLGLSHMQQQDAQEFFKLCLQKFEKSLSAGDPRTRGSGSFISTEFSGTLAYQTQCQNCKNVTQTVSTYYEIEVTLPQQQQNTTLESCLESNYLNIETMKGANMYACGKCASHQVATRQQVLRSLPDVITFHVLRFAYDPKTMTRKKNNAVLRFPETVDMSPYMASDDAGSAGAARPALNQHIYDLQAVIIHRGDSASSGHYIAQARDMVNNRWVQFDDEEAETIDLKRKDKKDGKSKNPTGDDTNLLKVMVGEDINDGSAQSRLRRAELPPGMRESKNAYILSYRRRETVIRSMATQLECVVPLKFHRMVRADNAHLRSEMATIEASYFRKMKTWKEKNDLFLSLYERLSPDPVDPSFVWVPSKWLESWFDHFQRKDSKAVTPPINTTAYCCPHGLLEPEDACDFKRVKTSIAEWLMNKYGNIGPKLIGSEAMCKNCVQDVFDAVKQKAAFNADQSSVRVQMRDIKVGKPKGPLTHIVCNNDVDGWLKLTIKRQKFQDADVFNGSVRCQHGNRKLAEGTRELRAVTEGVWDVLKRQYPNVHECRADAPECTQCFETKRGAEQRLDKLKTDAIRERELLNFIYAQDNVFTVDHFNLELIQDLKVPMVENTQEALLASKNPLAHADSNTVMFGIPAAFMGAWRRWARKPTDAEKPLVLDVGELICVKHGKMTVEVNDYMSQIAAGRDRKSWPLLFVSPRDWQTATSVYKVGGNSQFLSIYRTPDGRYASFPPACTDGCCAVNDPDICAHIFVRKITEEDALVRPAKRAVDDVDRSSQEGLAAKAHDKRPRLTADVTPEDLEDDESYECTVCRTFFRDAYNLKRHMKCATHKSAVAAAAAAAAPNTAATPPVAITMAPPDSSVGLLPGATWVSEEIGAGGGGGEAVRDALPQMGADMPIQSPNLSTVGDPAEAAHASGPAIYPAIAAANAPGPTAMAIDLQPESVALAANCAVRGGDLAVQTVPGPGQAMPAPSAVPPPAVPLDPDECDYESADTAIPMDTGTTRATPQDPSPPWVRAEAPSMGAHVPVPAMLVADAVAPLAEVKVWAASLSLATADADPGAQASPGAGMLDQSAPALSPRRTGLACKYCDKQCRRPRELAEHERTHTGEKPFGCPKCDKRFSRSSDVTRHLATPHPIRHRDQSSSATAVPVPMAAPPPVAAGGATCPPVAGGPGGSKPDLTIGYTENGSSFDCMFCDRSFPLRSSVLNHLRAHGIPPKRHKSPQDDASSDDEAFVPTGGEDGKNYNNRRSNRLDCKQFDVELHATVGTLRRLIMDVYGSMPTDQNLVFNDTVLTDPMATLAAYGIEIGSTVDFFVKTTDAFLEAGFEGTSLLGT